MSEIRADDMGPWLSPEDLAFVRRKVPFTYVEIVPVRLDPEGRLARIGLLLRTPREGGLLRSVISGRVMYHEPIRSTIARHVEKDLGPMALPRIPASLQPFTIAEYFPTPQPGAYVDPRQHSVSLVYIVPIDGDAAPQRDALQLAWLTPAEALDPDVQAELVSGHGALITAAITHLGALP